MSDEELRKAYQARRPGASDGGAPSPEELQRLVTGEGAEAERLRTLDRVFASKNAEREFELLRAIDQAERSAEARPRWRRVGSLALAASVLLAVAGVLTLRNRAGEPTRAPSVEGAPLQLLPAPDARVTGGVPFLWRSVPGAGGYRLEVLTDAGTVVTAIQTSDTTASYTPIGARGTQATYRWVVVALLPEGGEVASPPRRLILVTP